MPAHLSKSILFSLLLLFPMLGKGQVFLAKAGTIHFKSDAPLEVIEATSKKLKGAIDASKNTFAFTVEIQSLEGFNSPLQRTHFNENYLESDRFPTATFTGKIIDEVDWSSEQPQVVRAKGKFKIHGIEQERIIKGTLKKKGGGFLLTSNFTVLLEEHGISIPKIVYQKIAEEIAVDVALELSGQ